jgi:hypothetical protein
MSKLQRMAIAEAKALIERAIESLQDRRDDPDGEHVLGPDVDSARADLDKATGWLSQVLGGSKEEKD